LESQFDADMPQMEKETRQAQLREVSCGSCKPTTPKFSIMNIPDEEISHRANRLGVSLGLSEGEVTKTIKGIKLLEIKLLEEERTLTMLQER
jgi:hypothetical protein